MLKSTLTSVILFLVLLTTSVNCYNDALCAAADACSEDMFPTKYPQDTQSFLLTKFQYEIFQYDNFVYRFRGGSICRRYNPDVTPAAAFPMYIYFACTSPDPDGCDDTCYVEAARRLKRGNGGCQGKDGGVFSLGSCCLRYESYEFCQITTP